ncbi:MaoC family dehydratase N-terminal domain-containing protein [Pelagovum sp. HNIBRBA483]|uniref:FAS1-like dehydratase domain-containing protein n=1 Tax=Pelagovum sp. HNIBRBA483 TaxID=3233341 RepID=UPI0034A34AE0
MTSETKTDQLDPARAAAMEATLGRDSEMKHGSALPPFYHQLYFWSPEHPQNLGRDGHPKVGNFIPDLGLPRRMWAAGRLVFHAPLLAGVQAERESRIERVTRKTGKSGPLGFVTIRHDFRQRHGLALTEWQDIVYRELDAKSPPPPVARTDETESRTHHFDSTLLFRYSALTFNGHRIHYDADYARTVEGYRGLVVHGPLLAQLLMLFAEDVLGRPLKEFQYRATSPLICGEAGTFCWCDGDMWVRGPDGRQCMSANCS